MIGPNENKALDIIYAWVKREGIYPVLEEIKNQIIVRSYKQYKVSIYAADRIGMNRTAMIMARKRLGLNYTPRVKA